MLSDGRDNVRFVICHYYRPVDAQERMLVLTQYDARLETLNTGEAGLKKEEMAASCRINPGVVGDEDMWRKPALDKNGLAIPRSDKSAVFFTRGNTAVALIAERADYDVTPLAKAVDAALAAGMRKAGQALRREQPHVKP